ncbi:hypothetical protein TCELL_0849 [Thermogladius calderae 1633]|uniref:Uncharacterized protein n=2 Tax=Thermogladius calderae TaxID=1200300 RepID=I3TET5_THEC1|nr:hypothetical protein TCELL_0849 [Thermogladius calderae 1633]
MDVVSMSPDPIGQFYELITGIFSRVTGYLPNALVFLAVAVIGYLVGYFLKVVVSLAIDFYVKWKMRKYPLFNRLYESGGSVGHFIGWLLFSVVFTYSIYYGLLVSGSQHPLVIGSEAVMLAISRVLAGLLVIVTLMTVLVGVYSVASWVVSRVQTKYGVLAQIVLYTGMFFIAVPIVGLGVDIAGGGTVVLDSFQTYLPLALLLATVTIAGSFLALLLSDYVTSYTEWRGEIKTSVTLALKVLVTLLSFSAGVYLASSSYPVLSTISDVITRVAVSLTIAAVGLVFSVYVKSKISALKGATSIPLELADVYMVVPVLVAFIVVALDFLGIRAEVVMAVTVGSILLLFGLSLTNWVYNLLVKEGVPTELSLLFTALTTLLFVALSAAAYLAIFPEAAKTVGLVAIAVGLAVVGVTAVYYLRRR